MIDVRRVTLKNEYQNSASLSPILRAINSASLIEQKIAVPEKGRKKMAKLALRSKKTSNTRMPWVAKHAPMKVKPKEPHGGRGPRS